MQRLYTRRLKPIRMVMAKRKSGSPSNRSQSVTTVSEVRALAGEPFRSAHQRNLVGFSFDTNFIVDKTAVIPAKAINTPNRDTP